MSEQKICPTCGTEYPLSERFCPRDGTALRSSNTQGDLLGSVVADRYHILKKLGEGGMGTVYLAEHVKMGRKSALKVMNPGMNTDPDAIARFNREAANASRLSHPNICGIYDFGETPEGLIYLAMEFIEGQSLTSLIEKSGSLAAARAGSIIHQTADALQVAHDAGIVHRDLKPDNIMIAKTRDGGDLVKVVDFGIAKASSSEAQNVTRAGLVVGTPEYMSPEQLAADKLDGRSDLYSLALVAFNCLTGKLPFPADSAQEAMIARLTEQPKSLAEIRPDVAWPEELQATLDKALARDANDRYQSAAIFGREFAAAVANMPETQAAEGATMVISATKTPTPAAPVPRTRVAGAADKKAAATPAPAPKKSLAPILGGGGALIAAGAGVFFWMQSQKTTLPDPGLAGTSTPPTQAESSTVAANTPPANPQTQTPAGNPSGAATNPQTAPPTQPMSNPLPPANQPTNQPVNRPANTTTRPANTTGTPNTTPTTPAKSEPEPAPVPAGPSVQDRMRGWFREVIAQDVTPATARRVLSEIPTVREGLQGTELGEWHFIEMNAYVVLEDERACAAARNVLRFIRSGPRFDVATALLNDPGCQ